MIVTRSWLNEFIDLSEVSNEKLYATLNSIGLEVDSLREIKIDDRVVVGKILSCEKHYNADKLNVCQIDIGDKEVQIVCGASNVVGATYVAVATVGADLGDGFIIKDAKLRGVSSSGMVCASSEIGLPNLGKGIMILDDSIGELEVGKPINQYPKLADTIIEIELTANRGDCLSIFGVARDLCSALGLEMIPFEFKEVEKLKLGIAREAELKTEGKMDSNLLYKLSTIKNISVNLIVDLRLAFVDIETTDKLDSLLSYATHTTGVILRGYSSKVFRDNRNKIVVKISSKSKGITEVKGCNRVLSVVGVNQRDRADENSMEVLLEASYINPDVLVEAIYQSDIEKDTLYYKTSRGSNPDLDFGLYYLGYLLYANTDVSCYEGSLRVDTDKANINLIVDAKEISSIVGMHIELNKIVTILQKLGFGINRSMGNDSVSIVIPSFRHDVKNIQDISEEIVRIIGINNITSKPSIFMEKPRLNSTTDRYKLKKEIRNRAVSQAFYENISYLFSEKSVLQKYGFETLKESLDLTNPIALELNTLRSTVLINLLNAIKRNSSHSLKSIPLFEIGAVFDKDRNQKEVMSFAFCGNIENENTYNSGKPKDVDFYSFTKKLSSIIGDFELVSCTIKNGLIHPYQSADIIINGKKSGFLTKLHPSAQKDFGIETTFVAQIDFDALLPTHINASAISKFQGVYKDLSILIDKSLDYSSVERILNLLKVDFLQKSYPIDIYVDDKMGDKKSLTVRFFIQSMDRTLEDNDIEKVMGQIMMALEVAFQATLR